MASVILSKYSKNTRSNSRYFFTNCEPSPFDVLPDPATEIACNTYIESSSVFIGHDIDITLFVEHDKVWIDLQVQFNNFLQINTRVT